MRLGQENLTKRLGVTQEILTKNWGLVKNSLQKSLIILVATSYSGEMQWATV
jgi:hypothetical protein